MHSATLLLSALMSLATFTSASTNNLFLPRDTNFSALLTSGAPTTFFLANDTEGLKKVLATTSGCGQTPGPCDENGCVGENYPESGLAMCTQGQYAGCQCKFACTSGIKCSDPKCQGRSDPVNGGGECEGGLYAGCNCDSVCSEKNGPCSSPDCQGKNNIRGLPGTCLGGAAYGCFCDSVCGDKDGPCAATDCKGQDGVCTTGPSEGCDCDSSCGNLDIGDCNANGCNGVNSPSVGMGMCTSTALANCPCNNICPSKNVACSDSQCKGSNGVCTAGQYNGCNCS